MKVAVSEKLSKISSQEKYTLLKRSSYTISCLKTAFCPHPLDKKLTVDLDAYVMIGCAKRIYILPVPYSH